MGNPGLDRALFTRVACPVATPLRKRRRWVLPRPTELGRSFGADRTVRPASARTFGILVRILPAEYALMGEGGDGLEPLSRRRSEAGLAGRSERASRQFHGVRGRFA